MSANFYSNITPLTGASLPSAIQPTDEASVNEQLFVPNSPTGLQGDDVLHASEFRHSNDSLRTTLFSNPKLSARFSALSELHERGQILDVFYALSDPVWEVRQNAAVKVARGLCDKKIPTEFFAAYFEHPITPQVDPRLEDTRPAFVSRILARHACFRTLQELRFSLQGEDVAESLRGYLLKQANTFKYSPDYVNQAITLEEEIPSNPLRIYKAPLIKLLIESMRFSDFISRIDELARVKMEVSPAQRLLAWRESASYCPIIRETRALAWKSLYLSELLVSRHSARLHDLGELE